MEKLFKARWWDYHNRKFNINGRVCLETLVPFGLAGTVLLKWVNPFVLDLIAKVPTPIRKWVLVGLIVIITIDTIISFVVIGNFRKTAKEVEKEAVRDNTEEISNMVKEVTTQKAEEIKENVAERANEAKKNLENIPKAVQLNVKKATARVHFTGEKIYNSLLDSEQKLVKTRDNAVYAIKQQISKSQGKLKSALQNRITTTKEYTDAVKERFAKSWLNRRFLNAFPNLQARTKILRLNENNKKDEKNEK